MRNLNSLINVTSQKTILDQNILATMDLSGRQINKDVVPLIKSNSSKLKIFEYGCLVYR